MSKDLISVTFDVLIELDACRSGPQLNADSGVPQQLAQPVLPFGPDGLVERCRAV